ncbi:unnamed protein product [Closterium sp. Yama58-4]|nr:unnamed protein product [Closterium sp. Yama58-4]
MECEQRTTRSDSLRNYSSYSSSDDDGDGPGARARECKGGRIPRRSQCSQSPQAAVTATGAEGVSRSANAAAPPLPRLDAMGGAVSKHVRVVEDAALWYACAGPLVTVPAVGSLVVYFPQGHVEQQQRLAQVEPTTQVEHRTRRISVLSDGPRVGLVSVLHIRGASRAIRLSASSAEFAPVPSTLSPSFPRLSSRCPSLPIPQLSPTRSATHRN